MHAATLLVVAAAFHAEAPRSHPPMRSLPAASQRVLGPGPNLYVDAKRGKDDSGDGSRDKPWQSITHALPKLKPGDTLVLRSGVYYDALTISASGEAGKPLTIRSHPGELAVIDAGLREFAETPATAWEPAGDGARGEFRSAKEYKDLGSMVFGNFGDSLIPLHAYRHLVDLRSDICFWTIKNKLRPESGIYCGPGLWYDAKTGRIHARLQPTTLAALGEDNYKGEADPRKLSLIVGRPLAALLVKGARHLRFQDLVIRGSSTNTVRLEQAENVEFDGVTIYGASRALWSNGTVGLRITRSALRGISAPWSFRTSHKYRGSPAYVLMANPRLPANRDWEISYSELTDSHDGPFLGSVKGMKLHHCLVDNFNDDGVYVTACGMGGDLHIYQNVLSRCYHIFAYYGSFPTGSGVHVYRNIIDLRQPVYVGQPASADDPAFKDGMPGRGRLCGDHGSPTWEPMRFYQNTVVFNDAFRDYYGAGWGGHTGKRERQVFNNIFIQLAGNPGLKFDPTEADLRFDGNLLWGLRDGAAVKGDYFAAFQRSPVFTESQKAYPAGWTSHDRFADPKLTRVAADWRTPLDVRPLAVSPAINNGVELPADWPDPLRKADDGKPDIGALPFSIAMPMVGPKANRK